MEAYFARQPILDKELRLFGYELLFRSGPQAQASGSLPALDGDQATASVLDAVSAAGFSKVTGGTLAFVNFTEQLLKDGIATLYPKEYLAVEVLESVCADAQIIEAVRELKQRGYRIALDDYVYKPGDEPLIALSDIIKVEVDGTASAYKNLFEIARIADRDKCRLLAEKVETQDVFDNTSKFGCTLFQGYFFAKPKTIANKTVSALKVNLLRLMQQINKADLDFALIADIIKYDVGLSYKILRLVNSVFFGARHEITNVNQAVVFLGGRELKKWLAFVSLSELADKKPSELVMMCMTRARFLEQLAIASGRRATADAYFLAGLFSLLDVMTEAPLAVCLETITVAPAVRAALLEENNPGRDMLDLIIALEQGSWGRVKELTDKLGSTEAQIATLYMDCIDWARQAI